VTKYVFLKIHNSSKFHTLKTRGVSHRGLSIYIKKYLKAEEELSNLNISPCQNILFKKPSKRNQNPARYYNSITQVSTQAKNNIFQKSSYKKRPIT
jgi:hypothetical protein